MYALVAGDSYNGGMSLGSSLLSLGKETIIARVVLHLAKTYSAEFQIPHPSFRDVIASAAFHTV